MNLAYKILITLMLAGLIVSVVADDNSEAEFVGQLVAGFSALILLLCLVWLA